MKLVAKREAVALVPFEGKVDARWNRQRRMRQALMEITGDGRPAAAVEEKHFTPVRARSTNEPENYVSGGANRERRVLRQRVDRLGSPQLLGDAIEA